MKIRVILEETNENKEIDLKENSTVEDLLENLRIAKGRVIVIRKNELVDVSGKLKDGDLIRLMSVVSGG